MRKQRSTLADRFTAKVNTEGPLPESYPEYGVCWPWTAYIDPTSGYGKIGVDGKVEFAHRIAWELVAGPIPDGQYVLHTCDVRACQRNDSIGIYTLNGVDHPRRGHLWLGTYGDNERDMWSKKRHAVPTIALPHYYGDEHWSHKKPELVMRGQTHGRAKLTDAIVLDARRRVRAGLATVTELAKLYGVAVPVMRRAVNGQNWAHLNDPS